VRTAVRLRHYSRRTEKAYVDWIRRYILFHQKKHPSTMGAPDLVAFSRSPSTNRSARRRRIRR
jgi:hypothetical protein